MQLVAGYTSELMPVFFGLGMIRIVFMINRINIDVVDDLDDDEISNIMESAFDIKEKSLDTSADNGNMFNSMNSTPMPELNQGKQLCQTSVNLDLEDEPNPIRPNDEIFLYKDLNKQQRGKSSYIGKSNIDRLNLIEQFEPNNKSSNIAAVNKK